MVIKLKTWTRVALAIIPTVLCVWNGSEGEGGGIKLRTWTRVALASIPTVLCVWNGSEGEGDKTGDMDLELH